jgi:alpha-amylase/alpha-mannosidase (GH57 family)
MGLAPLKVALLWHMHQPCYKDPRTGVYRLPWVRLHTVKDYYDMAARLDAHPGVRANFNLVPILVEQIQEYASGRANEVQLELAAKSPGDLTEQEKLALVKDSFLGNRKKMIEPYPRYRSLLDKCPQLDVEYKARSAIRKCSRQDFLDLQVWSNLAWMDPIVHDDPLVADLLARGRQFSEPMKSGLLDKQMQIMRDTLPKYKELADRGQIEIAFSPYYHPIVPLLCDPAISRVSRPEVRLPERALRVPEDAEAQLALGRSLHREVFGRAPVGLWPPEGSVSDETLGLASRAGVRWVATDEGILERSLGLAVRDAATGKVTRPDLLYRPHRFACDGGEVAVLFRDKVLSDLISFEYSSWPPAEAVADFVARLDLIRSDLADGAPSSVVLVALDGENCWEFYDRDGDAFLTELYGTLARTEWIETVRLSEVVEAGAVMPCLKSIYPGSWINSNFDIWIGSAEDNCAWDMLADARGHLVAGADRLGDADRRAAWQSVYAAEGSDWFWWYGGEHVSRHNPEYDALFRSHIRRIYEACGMRTPPAVLHPVLTRQRGPAFVFEPAAIMKPVLDGRVTTFYEWRLAGLYESYRDVSRHTPVTPIITAVYFGFDDETLYVRVDTGVSPQARDFTALALRLEFETPLELSLTLRALEPCSPECPGLAVEPAEHASVVRAAALECLEAAVPFAVIGVGPGETFGFRVAVVRDGRVLERRPFHELISVTAPTKTFEAEMWSTL